jgi:hypothetical protein
MDLKFGKSRFDKSRSQTHSGAHQAGGDIKPF